MAGEEQQTLLEQGVSVAANIAGVPPETAVSSTSVPAWIVTKTDDVADRVLESAS